MEIAKGIAPEAALKAVMHGLKDTDSLSGRTHLMITPHQYTFQVVDELVTNFHAPDSTLMLLVSAFLQRRKQSQGCVRRCTGQRLQVLELRGRLLLFET